MPELFDLFYDLTEIPIAGHQPEEPFGFSRIDIEAPFLYDCPGDLRYALRFFISVQLNLAQVFDQKVHAVFNIWIVVGSLKCCLEGAELQLFCQRTDFAGIAPPEVISQQDIFPCVTWSPGLQAKWQERAFFQQETCVFKDGIGDFVFDKLAFELSAVVIGPVEDENFSSLKSLLDKIDGNLGG